MLFHPYDTVANRGTLGELTFVTFNTVGVCNDFVMIFSKEYRHFILYRASNVYGVRVKKQVIYMRAEVSRHSVGPNRLLTD